MIARKGEVWKEIPLTDAAFVFRRKYVGISMDEEGLATVKPYVEKTRVTDQMVLADSSTLEGDVVTSIPASLFIDRKERIAPATCIGLVYRRDIETNIKAVAGQCKARLRRILLATRDGCADTSARFYHL